MDERDERELNTCLNSIIQKVDQVTEKLKDKHKQPSTSASPPTSQPETGEDPLFNNSVQNNNVNTFTIDNDEKDLLDTLTNDVQNILRGSLPLLSKFCSTYIEEYLHQYHFNREQAAFTEGLTANILYTFQRELRGLLMAAKAYPSALRGERDTVREFLNHFPNYKDKAGYWGTTLLYSAARNGHLLLVKYLIESVGCSVNAQNIEDINFALSKDNASTISRDYKADPKAASTALHAACYNNHLDVVKYLIGKGANYFLLNQLGETPIQNAQHNRDIKGFFQNYLILTYTTIPNVPLPNTTILDSQNRAVNDCVWEYKPVRAVIWEEFTKTEHDTLSASLMPITDEQKQFSNTIYLSVRQGTYSVQLLTFLRGGKNQDPSPTNRDSLAWIRCRGSSIANFDIHCTWQMMLVQHHKVNSQTTKTPSLEALAIPVNYDSKFQLQLHNWYTCNTTVNDILDHTMNYRRIYVDIDCKYIGTVTANLHKFTFANDEKTILGFIRWIPKFISNTSSNKNTIKELDDFQSVSSANPIPLTTKRLEQSIRSKATNSNNVGDENDEFDLNMMTVEDEADDDDDDSNTDKPSQSAKLIINNGTWVITDIMNPDIPEENELGSPLLTGITTMTIIPDEPGTFNDYVSDRANKPANSQEKIEIKDAPVASNNVQQAAATVAAKTTLEIENEQLRVKMTTLEQQINEQLTNFDELSAANQQKLGATMTELDRIHQVLDRKENQEKMINETAKKISIIEYTLPQSSQLVLLKLSLIIKILKTLDYPHKQYFIDSVPIVEISDRNNCTLILKGFLVHHQQLKAILDRLQALFTVVQSAQDYYQRELNKSVRQILRIIGRVHSTRLTNWKHYSTSLIKLIHQKLDEYTHNFNQYINDQSKLLIDGYIESRLQPPLKEMEKLTNDYMKKKQLLTDIETLKHQALDEFVRDHILVQQNSSKSVPKKESILTLNKHIDKIKTLLKTNSSYNGCELKHFQMIVPLLQRIMIFYHCFLLQLPLFDASVDLMDKIDKNTVLTITTATGSGKSTLLPALLVAEGYDKIIVTQPRRLPCNLISQRVNTMIDSDISGWAVSGAEKNVQAKILYLTDGLLKERLLNDENLITKNTQLSKYVIFFMDEVHERSVNIDLCLGLFARLLTIKPELKTKMKLIISSATLDASVPKLYRQIPNCALSEFNLISLSTLHPVTVNSAEQENILDLVQQLYKKRMRHDQILCFVSSTQEVKECCERIKYLTNGSIDAYPLIQAQSAIEQEKNIEQGAVFFSTTVAETSLTFPCLKYVIDTGLINMPVYSLELERTDLKETKAAESNTKQRLGRLGRTQPGEYYALYAYKPGEQRPYPIPQICQTDLVNIEFSLRKSPLKTSLKDFKKYLPDQPDQLYINDAIKQLQRLGILSTSPGEHFTSHGAQIGKLPDFGSLPMSKAVLSALTTNRCGRDLIVLSSILSVLNSSTILKSIPEEYKPPEGDFMTLLNVMNMVLLVRESVSSREFSVDRVCTAKRLSRITHVIKQALRRYTNLEKAFSLSNDFRELAQVRSGKWELIAKALLAGYSDKVYVSLKILQGKTQQFLKYNVATPKSPSNETVAVIDTSSKLRTKNKGPPPASLVLARDVLYLTAVRSTAIISFVGQIESSWIEYRFIRELPLNENEEKKFNDDNILSSAIRQFSQIHIHVSNKTLILRGPSGEVLNAELHIRQQLVTEFKFTLSPIINGHENQNLKRNLTLVTKMPIDLFGPLRWRWEAQHQVKIRTKNNHTNGTVSVTVEGLDSQNQLVYKEFISFSKWLSNCVVIRNPDSAVPPRMLKRQLRKEYADMEEKISHVTNEHRSPVDIWKSLQGPTATRETRMEVVAWVAVCEFKCRLEGGFVRDWIVGNYSTRPTNLLPKQWIEYQSGTNIPMLNKQLVPSDLDCHLPASEYFDIEKFSDRMYKFKISAKVFRQDWRYVVLFDEDYETGPFTMDLIEPHIALTHDRIDFDVSNLSLEKDYTRELGMRVDITSGTHPIQLEQIVDNIRNKRFQVLRPIEGEQGVAIPGAIRQRIDKMEARGWTQFGKALFFIPDPPTTYNAVLIPFPSSTTLYQNLVTEMKKIPGSNVISIEQIKNPDIEALYEYMKKTISKECPGNDPNERELFHGTKADGIDGIFNRGFDDRYYNSGGAWGHGAYFADDPRKSHAYTAPDVNTQQRIIFYNKVLLGVQSVMTATNALSAAPVNYHSVHGTGFAYNEYIVYRYGQALPYLKITYTTP